jgi:hypothetical protein
MGKGTDSSARGNFVGRTKEDAVAAEIYSEQGITP